MVDVQLCRPQVADGAASSLRDEECLVVVPVEAVLSLETSPTRPPAPLRVSARPRQKALSVAVVASALLGGPAGFAEGVSSEATALLQGELVEGFHLMAVPAGLALLFHHHAS